MRNSNTFREGILRGISALLFGACLLQTAFSLDPTRSMSQYIRNHWGPEQGFPGGPVHAIAQTPDGYLWIGAERGLVRFDGLKFQLLDPASNPSLPEGPVLGLATDREGRLWIRMQGPRLLRYQAGRFADLRAEFKIPELGITAMYRTPAGEILFSTLINGLLQYRDDRFIPIASLSNRPNFLVLSMAESATDTIWLGTRDAGLYRLRGNEIESIAQGLPDPKINCLLPDGDRDLWIGTDRGLVRWSGEKLTRDGVPQRLQHLQALTTLRDRDANLWIGTATNGVFRFHNGMLSSLDEDPAGAGKSVSTLFEDREGNLWIGGVHGLDRLREGAFRTYSSAEKIPASIGPVFADLTQRIWFAPVEGGLYWMIDRQVERIGLDGLARDIVYSISGTGQDLWIGRQRGGLTQLHAEGNTFAVRTHTEANGLAQNSVFAVHQSRDGSVWAGTLSGGVSHLQNGQFTTYLQSSAASGTGPASNSISAIAEGPDGNMWFATPNGLSLFSNGRWQSYSTRDGLPSESVLCLSMGASGILWIGTGKGLAFIQPGHTPTIRSFAAALQEPILGLAEDRRGSLWLSLSNRVVEIKREALLAGSIQNGQMREYGPADGLRAIEGGKRNRSVVADSLGRIWFSLPQGLSMVDPAQAAKDGGSSISNQVDLLSILVDGRSFDRASSIRLPPIRQRLSFRFTGLNLTAPESLRYRFRMEGFEPGWNETDGTGEASYTSLGPGQYRFHVMASNAYGQWNGVETILPIEIEPEFWQTWWFRLAAVGALGLLAATIYRLRLRQLTRQMNLRFEAQMAERMRIAQDLHDTLLQGCISASMQLHIAADQVPADSAAKPMLNRIVELMSRVIDEGRNAVRSLRTPTGNSLDLEEAFSRIPRELGPHQNGQQADFRVVVEGRPRMLHPILRDEIYRIGREAILNAFRHAQAGLIEVELEYEAKTLHVLVRDNGRGIDAQVLRSGRDGHWGLAGMRERAERIGARLQVRSRADAGTEVDLAVPGSIAYQQQKASQSTGEDK